MLQRTTIMNLMFFENKAIKDYTTAIKNTDDIEQIRILTHILDEEIEHKRELEDLLKKYVMKKGQTDITKLLQL